MKQDDSEKQVEERFAKVEKTQIEDICDVREEAAQQRKMLESQSHTVQSIAATVEEQVA